MNVCAVVVGGGSASTAGHCLKIDRRTGDVQEGN